MGTVQRKVSGELAAAAEQAPLARQIRELVRWLGPGRKLTQTGRVALADARELVHQLQTGDRLDPEIGGEVFRTKSSEDLIRLTLIVEWARAAHLLRTQRGRLVPVKRQARLLDRSLELWTVLFTAFPQLGQPLLPGRWLMTPLRDVFAEVAPGLLGQLDGASEPVPIDRLRQAALAVIAELYDVDNLSADDHERLSERLRTEIVWCLEPLEALGALRATETVAELTDLGQFGVDRLMGRPLPGDSAYQIRVTLTEVERPEVWRRLLVPAGIRLDRFHEVLQAAMGWEDSHLHSFSDGTATYGYPEPELDHRDERRVRLLDVVGVGRTLAYTYDFGDGWEHELLVEREVAVEPGTRYPVCVAGEGACPPEDCGGPPGYERVRRVLADPEDDEFESMVEWMGLSDGRIFDPWRIDLEQINRELHNSAREARYPLSG